MFLDTLGVSATHGISVVVKQAFYGFWFSLLDASYHPTASYWIAYLYKQLVGRAVLRTTTTDVTGTRCANDSDGKFRAYTHCTSPRSGYPRGSVVVYAMNLHDRQIHVNFPHMTTAKVSLYEYLFTSHDGQLESTSVECNGNVIRMVNDTVLPHLKPHARKPSETVVMPPKSMGFYVFSGSKTKGCEQTLTGQSGS